MKVNQIAETLNKVTKEVTGLDVLFAEDLSDIVDSGKQVLNFFDNQGNLTENYDNYMGKLIDQIGKIVFVDRTYTSTAPNILKDSWEYGSIMMKVRAELMDAKNNSTWQLGEIADGTGLTNDKDALNNPIVPSRLDPFVLSKPNVNAKFYNKKVTYEVPISLAREQLKEAFRSASDMSRFFSMIENRISMKRTLCNDALIMATIRNLIGNKVINGKGINLLNEYNKTLKDQTKVITADQFWTNPDAIRFANKTIALYKKYLREASTLYNDSEYVTFTPESRLKAVFLSEYVKDAEVYLYSDTFHNEFDKLNGYEEVGYWQGTGKTPNDLTSRATIMGTFIRPNDKTFTGSADGIIAVLFDEQAAAVCCENDRVTSIYNPRAEYTNYFYKWDANYMNDLEENVVVFYVSDYTYEGAYEEAPSTWATAYAIDNSPYYYWDATNETYAHLTTSDAITEQNPWTNYQNLAIAYKAPTT